MTWTELAGALLCLMLVVNVPMLLCGAGRGW